MSLTFAGHNFDVADLTELPWPTSTGGNTKGVCPLQDFTRTYYNRFKDDPSSDAVFEHLKANAAAVWQCFHHRRSPDQLRYVADLSCWFVEAGLQPFDDSIEAVVARDNKYELELAKDTYVLFIDPMKWSFVPGEPLSNGRHRLCAFKAAGIERVAIQRL